MQPSTKSSRRGNSWARPKTTLAAIMDQTTIAMANIQAAALKSRSSGISLVPVVEWNIVHSNNIVPEEMVQAMMAEPTFAQ